MYLGVEMISFGKCSASRSVTWVQVSAWCCLVCLQPVVFSRRCLGRTYELWTILQCQISHRIRRTKPNNSKEDFSRSHNNLNHGFWIVWDDTGLQRLTNRDRLGMRATVSTELVHCQIECFCNLPLMFFLGTRYRCAWSLRTGCYAYIAWAWGQWFCVGSSVGECLGERV